ncbi:GWxTD domain-containing protein [bacterium]|nr:GWxTD domain-containing protein [bacterium]
MIKRWLAVWMIFSGLGFASDLSLVADLAAFYYDGRAAYTEIYYQIQQKWENKAPAGPWEVRMNLRILRNDSLYNETTWNEKAQPGARPDIALDGRVYFLAVEGDYHIQLTALNINDAAHSDDLRMERSIKPFLPDPLCISDIELATEITYATEKDKENPFYKNSLLVKPNAPRVFDVTNPILYYYFEIYTASGSTFEQPVDIRMSIADKEKETVSGIAPVQKSRTIENSAVVEMGQIGLFKLASGEYSLHVRIQDAAGNSLAEQAKPFYMFNPASEPEEVMVDKDALYRLSPFVEMESAEVDMELKYAGYFMTGSDKKLLKKIKKLDGRRQFLFDFWLKRDPNPKTVVNEAYESTKKRIQEADDRFSTMRREGWKTDRGRVYIAYGPPTDVDQYPSSSGRVPYEIWLYDQIEGGVQFIFADLSGYKEYQLIHSTKRGEVYNSEWEGMLRQGF